MFSNTVSVADHQRAFVYKSQQLTDILMPGEYRFWGFRSRIETQIYDVNELYFTDSNAARLFEKSPLIQQHITHEKLSETETALLYVNDKLQGIVAPGEQLYLWKDAGNIRLERIDLQNGLAVDEAILHAINHVGANCAGKLIKGDQTVAITPIQEFIVQKDHQALLYVDGQQTASFTAGRYGFWQFHHQLQVKQMDCRTRVMEISGQEILSKDRVSLRINLNANIKVIDPELALSSAEDVMGYIYQTLQLALREAVGIKTLDDLLIDKLYINETIKELVTTPLMEMGVHLQSVGIKDIILPGEMKAILNQVVEAQKAAEANVIKRREETAATRSLHNTAKMMENNPILMRLKELESLEKVAEKIETLTVYGGLEGLMNGTIHLNQ